MSQINLSNWEIDDDPVNNRIVIRSIATGELLELNESGVFSSSSGIDADTVDGIDADQLGADIANSGTPIVSNTSEINFLGDISAFDDGDGTTTVDIDDSFVRNDGDSMTGDLDMGGTSTVVNVPDPSNSQDIANKRFVESIEQGLDIKDSARAATDGANVDLASSTDPNPIDGVTLVDGDRVLLKDQTTATENGIYEAVTATDPTTWVRTADADEDAEVNSGLFLFIEEGTANTNNSFVLQTPDPITLGSTSLNFTVFAKAGEILAGTNLERSGDTLNVLQGSGSGLDADTLDGEEAAALALDVSNNGSVVTPSSTEIDFSTNLNASSDGDGTSTVAVAQGTGSGLDADTVDGVEEADIGPDVSDDGAIVTSSSTDLDLTTNLAATDDGDGTSTLSVSPQGSGSGLDADTTDGVEASDLHYSETVSATSNTVASNRQIILADSSSGAITITLPAPSDGQLVTVKKIDSSSNAVTIATPNTETIDGQSSISLTNQFATRETCSNGTNYFII